MKSVLSKQRGREGFTLIEVIITLIVAAVLGTMLIRFMGSNLTGSAEALVRVQNGFQLNKMVESITRDYRNWIKDTPDEDLTQFKSDFLDTYPSDKVSSNYNEINTGKDGDIDILMVKVSDGTQSLVVIFTK